MKKLFIGNLPPEASEASVTDLFSPFGTVRSIEIVKDIFSGKCKGFGFIEMEGHEARAAIAGLDGSNIEGSMIKVRYQEDKAKGRKAGRR